MTQWSIHYLYTFIGLPRSDYSTLPPPPNKGEMEKEIKSCRFVVSKSKLNKENM